MASDPVTKDPVCGMTVDPKSAAAKRVYGGRTFYFCAKGCAEAFDGDPKKYLEGGPRGMPPRKAPSPPPAGRSLRETRSPSASAAGATTSKARETLALPVNGGGPPEPPRAG